MTPIDKKNYLIVSALFEFEKLTSNEAKKIALMITNEMINEVELLRIEDIDYKDFILKYWKRVKNELEKL
jgi:hypothetical protein